MEIGKVVEIGDRKIEMPKVSPARAPQRTPAPAKLPEKQPA